MTSLPACESGRIEPGLLLNRHTLSSGYSKIYNFGDAEGLPGYFSHNFQCVNVEYTCQRHKMDIGLYLVLRTGPGLRTPVLACYSSPRTFATDASSSDAVTDTSLRFHYIRLDQRLILDFIQRSRIFTL